MRIGILGSGTMGSALAQKLARAGHSVCLGSRQGLSHGGIRGGTYREAARHGQAVVLAIPWPFGLRVVSGIEDVLENRVLIDVSNPETEDGRGLAIGHGTSGAEEIARLLPKTRVVKAFSHFYAELLLQDVHFDGGTPSVLFCGDDDDAKGLVRRVILGCGFDPVDAGPLVNARYLEPFALLTVQLVREQGWGPAGMAWRVMRAVDRAEPGGGRS